MRAPIEPPTRGGGRGRDGLRRARWLRRPTAAQRAGTSLCAYRCVPWRGHPIRTPTRVGEGRDGLRRARWLRRPPARAAAGTRLYARALTAAPLSPPPTRVAGVRIAAGRDALMRFRSTPLPAPHSRGGFGLLRPTIRTPQRVGGRERGATERISASRPQQSEPPTRVGGGERGATGSASARLGRSNPNPPTRVGGGERGAAVSARGVQACPRRCAAGGRRSQRARRSPSLPLPPLAWGVRIGCPRQGTQR